ncbi:MAG: helicase HerA domain-containing protein, partial [Anaerolineales bacterium]
MRDEKKFFIGRSYDLKGGKLGSDDIHYDPGDLTTHGVVIGMTGSGKTGLCVDILEEAALQGLPALIVDPKGDIANLQLHFPNQSPADFHPWVDPDEARRSGVSLEALAEKTAATWSEGLARWGIDGEQIQRVCEAVEYAVYTPGSDAGIPVSILASLKAPGIKWEENREQMREKNSSTVTALLGLVGIVADPVRSREHILLANLFEAGWKAGQDMDLMELIRQIQSPPMDRLGALELEQFYPEKDRFELAMLLNNLLASPSFEAWIEGIPLDIERLLWTTEGKPRHSVFYLAHLPDSERMFFVTLLMTAVEGWMRGQSGSPSLRALIYFDEVLGYMPPVANPPSKPPMLRLLKQARAFGVGLLLTTQNPVDLDYKGLSNAGTWFIGKLQTEQDKARLLDGLESAESEAGFKRAEIDRLISDLDKRVFILHNVHEQTPMIFQTRWAMAYLRGPITRDQIRPLNELVSAKMAAGPRAAAPAAAPADSRTSATRPAVPQGTPEYFLPNNLTSSEALKTAGREAGEVTAAGLVYKPALLAQAVIRYLDRKHGIDTQQSSAAMVEDADRTGVVRWEDWVTLPVDAAGLDRSPATDALFGDLFAPLNDASQLRSLETDFKDFIYHSQGLKLLSNSALELIASPEMTKAGFHQQLSEAASKARDAEVESLREKYETKIDRIQDRLTKEERELAEDESELSARKMEELATHAENILGLFGGSRSRRRVSSSLTKRRMTSKAKADVEESHAVIEDLQKELAEMEAELRTEIEQIHARWAEVAEQVEETVVTPYKKDIRMELFGVAWKPF